MGSDLGNLGRVQLRTRNAASSTTAGVSDQADKLIKAGLIKTPQQFLELMETGNIETLYETEQSENDLINSENDLLREGKIVHAMSTDVHPVHIGQHRQVMNDPELRRLASQFEDGGANSPSVAKAAGILKAAQDHIIEHLDLQKDTDPVLLAICATGNAPQMAPAPGGN